MSTVKTQRLVSLDALRGFDMFWILGADALCQALKKMSPSEPTRFLAYELDHADWIGFHFYDLIFPLFVFIVGVSIVFSLGRTVEAEGRKGAMIRILRRTLLLYLCAIIYQGGLRSGWSDIRWMGVLNRIALAYCGASLAFCFFKTRGLVTLCAGLLIGYWALMSFVAFPDVRPNPGGEMAIFKEGGFTNVSQLNFAGTNQLRGVFIKGVNLANYVDQKYLPGKKWDGTWDPEGLLSTFPAIATCLLGVMAGLFLRCVTVSDIAKVKYLLFAGVVAIILGWLWSVQFPVVKKIWTSSYVLVAGGYSAVLLALFYLVVDVWKWRGWCEVFVWIGMNSITVYMAKELIGFSSLAQRFAGGDVRAWLNTAVLTGLGDLVLVCIQLTLAIVFVRFLYRRQIFLRV